MDLILKLKLKLINKIHGGKNLREYKRSYKHPIINQRFFNIDMGYCTVTKVWNIKEYSTCSSGHNYEKNDKIVWNWKIQIKTDLGYYVMSLQDFISKSSNADGSKINDNMLFIFYK